MPAIQNPNSAAGALAKWGGPSTAPSRWTDELGNLGDLFDFGSGDAVSAYGYPTNIGRMGSRLLGAGEVAGWGMPTGIGLALSAADMGMRAGNLAQTNRIRTSLGAPDTNFWQGMGGIFGWNDYADIGGNPQVLNREQAANAGLPGAGVGVGGLRTSSWGPFGLFGDHALHTEYTPDEARMHQIMSKAPAARKLANPARPAIGATPASGLTGGNAGFGGRNADVGFGPGNYASTTGAPSGPAITSRETGSPIRDQPASSWWGSSGGVGGSGSGANMGSNTRPGW